MKSALLSLRPLVLVALLALLVSPLLSALSASNAERKATDVEDCVACRYIWLQVEMVSGGKEEERRRTARSSGGRRTQPVCSQPVQCSRGPLFVSVLVLPLCSLFVVAHAVVATVATARRAPSASPLVLSSPFRSARCAAAAAAAAAAAGRRQLADRGEHL